MPIRAVVFDLGGVLVELGGVEEFGALVGESDPERIWRLWLGSPAVRAYERGHCERGEFARLAVAEFGLDLSPGAFLERFLRWPKGLFPGAAELVRSVRVELHRAVLSNTNEMHWNEQLDADGIRGLFHSHFASHEVGLVKPDREIYEHVIEALGERPEEILFLDDNEPNVVAAREIGIVARRVRGVAEARAALREHHVLGDDT